MSFLFNFLWSIGLTMQRMLLGPKFVCENKHRAPQNLKNFVGDTSEVQATTNLPAGIYAEENPFPAKIYFSRFVIFLRATLFISWPFIIFIATLKASVPGSHNTSGSKPCVSNPRGFVCGTSL